MTEGYNADDIQNICRDACMCPLRKMRKKLLRCELNEIQQMEEQLMQQEIKMEYFLEALKNIKSSSSVSHLTKYQKWTSEFASV